MIIQVEDIKKYPVLSISRFTGENSIRAWRYAEPYRWDDDFTMIKIDKGWRLLGWNYASKLPYPQSELRRDMLIVMFETPEGDNVWSHFIETDDLVWAKNERKK